MWLIITSVALYGCLGDSLATATLTSEPEVLERLEVTEAVPEPAEVDGADSVVVAESPLTTDSAAAAAADS